MNKKLRNLPFTVVYKKEGVVVRKRLKDSKEAWKFMMETGGALNMAFRCA